METIQQIAAPKTSAPSKSNNMFDNDFFNDYSAPSMYSSSGSSRSGGFSKADKQELEIMGFEPIESSHKVTSMFSANDNDYNKPKPSATNAANKNNSNSNYGKSSVSTNKNSNYEENTAQKKFGTAKGFGSDQFFGNEQSSADITSNLSRFQGSNSISSSDYFGDGSQNNRAGSRGEF